MLLKEQLYVCTLARTGLMTEAAERLFISQPALSGYIKSLEERMGAPLFLRRQGQYVLTYLGRRYVDTAEKMLALQDNFNLEMQMMKGGTRGRVRLGLQTRRSPMIIGKILRFFQDRYPHLEVSLEEGNQSKLIQMLKDDRIDIMVCSVERREEGIGYRTLGMEKLLLAVHEHNPVLYKLQQGKGLYPLLKLEDVAEEKFFLPLPEQSLRKSCDRLFIRSGFAPAHIMEIRSIEASLRLVSEGLGVAFNRTSYAKDMRIEGIRYAAIAGDSSTTEVALAFAPEYEMSHPIKGLLDSLEALLRLPD